MNTIQLLNIHTIVAYISLCSGEVTFYPSDVGGKSYTPDWSEIGWFPRVTFFWGIKFGVNELISFKGDIYIVHLLFDHISLYPVYPL